MPRTSSLPNDEYRAYRAQQRLTAIERGTEEYLSELQRLHQQASDRIRADLEYMLQTYMRNGKLEYDAALALLRDPMSEAELINLRAQAALIEDLEERNMILARLNASSYAARIRRLEAIELAGQLELKILAPQMVQTVTKSLLQTGAEAYNRTVFDIQRGTGFGYDFTKVTRRQIEEVLKNKWVGGHYSDRIWANTDTIAARIPRIVQQNMLTGRSWRRCIGEVDDLVVKGGQYSAERILRTENAYVANELEAEAYEDAGVEVYEFVATLDNRTSTICQEHDGKRYKLKDRDPGTNFPPLHPHCRSTTVSVDDAEVMEGLERRARGPDGKNILIPAGMKYPEWKKKYGVAE